MAANERYLSAQVRDDLARKMVFVAGPRQVGKTTLARTLLGKGSGYQNWDVPEHRERILRGELPSGPLLVLDEIHKWRSWRRLLKGIWDRAPRQQQVLVTGSARLDLYRYGGDSLQGRYHLLRLHPLSLAEVQRAGKASPLRDLLTLGGFPEPFLGGSERQARRWSREYRTRLVRDDIAGLEPVADIGNLELLALRLPDLVGSPLSINALREDLHVAHKTVASWLEKLARLYAIFFVAPFGAPRLRAVHRARKHYHFDWSIVTNDAARFENLVGSHLLKWVHFMEDSEGRDLSLCYFRDVDGREVDFVIVEGKKPILFVECKWSDALVDRGLVYLKERFPAVPAWQVSATGERDFVTPLGIRVAPAEKLLADLV